MSWGRLAAFQFKRPLLLTSIAFCFRPDYPRMPRWYFPRTDGVTKEIDAEEVAAIQEEEPVITEPTPKRRRAVRSDPNAAKSSEELALGAADSTAVAMEDRAQATTAPAALSAPVDTLIDPHLLKRLNHKRVWSMPLEELHAEMEASLKRFVEKTLEQLLSSMGSLHRPTRRFFAHPIRPSLVRQAIREQRKIAES